MLLYALISILWIPVGALTQCPVQANEHIQLCVQPVAEYAKILNQQDGSNASQKSEFGQAIQLPKLGGQVFRELCRLIRNFDSCVLDYRHQCPKHITISLIDASYGYLCNEGYDTFMMSAECLMELDQRPSVKRCHDDTLRDIEKANAEHGITMPTKLDRMCDALNFFSGCVRLPIRHNCGVEAWQVIFRVLKDTTRTLMPACQFTGTSPRLQNHHRHSQSPIHVTAAPSLLSTTAVIPRPRIMSIIGDSRKSGETVGSQESLGTQDVLIEENLQSDDDSYKSPSKVIVDSLPGHQSSYTDDSSGVAHMCSSTVFPSVTSLLLLFVVFT
ncbi:hypothetical protein L596_018995 [Steinernema carpocapsae]|uniref:DUF19 domain-containing protein n=1 Tax=Steinernema carpocapsae TaxID=34508 RepID=A0A4U5N6D1_STECR|nr:hypothetical protein L596_018995 [Steinernema carpocapsae]